MQKRIVHSIVMLFLICNANVLFNIENGNSKNYQSVGTKLQVQTPLTYDINQGN